MLFVDVYVLTKPTKNPVIQLKVEDIIKPICIVIKIHFVEGFTQDSFI